MQAMLLAKAQKQLESGQNPEAVLKQLAHGLTNKLIHEPTAQMRHAAENGDADLLHAAERLLNIKKPAE